MTVNLWLWLGFAGMAIGSVVLLAMGWNRRTRDEENHWLLHLFVCLTAMASYLLMAMGQGSTVLADGREFFVARYVDWSITTPLLLLGLCLTALRSPFRRWALLLGILFTDVYMIATGVIAGFSPAGSAAKWIWFLISSGAFAFIYVGLWGPLRAEARTTGPKAAALYTRNAGILSLLWLAYPVIFLLGNEGTSAIGPVATGALYTIFDVISKVAYGILALRGTQARTSDELREGAIPEQDLRPAPRAYHEVHRAGVSKAAARD